jgi:hypothetical protein
MSVNEALRKVAVEDLQVGMHVIMPVSWKAHPFLVNIFHISSPNEIRKIAEAGLKEVTADLERSNLEGSIRLPMSTMP